MQITITYSTVDSTNWPCCASTKIGGQSVVALGKTFDDAKMDLLLKVRNVKVIPPEPETVDVEVV